MMPIAPAPPVADGNLHSTSAAGSGSSAAEDPRHVDARLDALMNEANKSYDGGNYDEAKSTAEKVLLDQPHNVRMLRILVSVACLDSDQPTAQKSYDQLPKADRDQMKIRCGRSGVTFTDSTPPP
jgi:predicted Zn-dependent protease